MFINLLSVLVFSKKNPLSCHQSQHHDDEKRALSREIIVLNNHLMEAKLTIEKLQEDNVRAPLYFLLRGIKYCILAPTILSSMAETSCLDPKQFT